MSTEATEKVADGLTALAGIDLDVLCDEALNRLVVELQVCRIGWLRRCVG